MEKLKVGDIVQVLSGAERSAGAKTSKRGKVISIDRKAERLSVEGLRLVKKHLGKGKDRGNPDGGVLERPGSISLASVALVCPKCDASTRVGIRAEGDKRVRFCKKCDGVIDSR